MERTDKLCLEGIYRQGYGIVPKYVMQDQDITLESKAIYAYLCALAGSGDITFPYRDTILRHLGLSKNTYYRHYNPLLEEGYLSVTRPPDKTAANIYTLIQNPKKLPERPSQGEGSRLRYRGIKAHGYGMIPRSVMLDDKMTAKTKGLYAYFCSYCGSGDVAFPRRDHILYQLGISEPTYYKCYKQLIESGYLTAVQRRDLNKFGVNDYYLNEEPETNPPQAPAPPKKPKKYRGGYNIPRLYGELLHTEEYQINYELSSKASKSDSHKNRERDIYKRVPPQIESSFNPSCPKNEDIEITRPIFWDIEKQDANYNNSNSINNLSNNNPSIDIRDGRIQLRFLAIGLMEELAGKAPQKTQAVALAAREYLRYAWENHGEGEAFIRLQEEFIQHIGDGLQGKKVRNLRAYCKTALYNWLAEQPLRDDMKKQRPLSRAPASYDLEELERLLEKGELYSPETAGLALI